MLSPTYAFRVDASTQIGTGHVMRCLTLALELRERGANCLFICCKCPGNLLQLIQHHGFESYELKNSSLGQYCFDAGNYVGPAFNSDQYLIELKIDARETLKIIKDKNIQWLIIDHYGVDARWEIQLRDNCRRLMVIDDLANRQHDCDLLLDQNLRVDAEARYKQLVSDTCKLMLGPSNVILRPSFDNQSLRIRDGNIKTILVYFGGNDIHNQAFSVARVLQKFPQIDADIVLGLNHPFRDNVYDAVTPNLRIHESVDMAEAMLRADLAIGVCGIAAWERCAMGLPTLVCVNANNQREDSESLHRLGAVECLGDSSDLNVYDWIEAISRAINDPLRISKMGQAAYEVVKGHAENRKFLLDILLTASHKKSNNKLLETS